MASDRVTLSVPRDSSYVPVVSHVLGGLAARLDFTVESLEDLQLALEMLLTRGEGPTGRVTLELLVRDDALVARLGPLGGTVIAELEQDSEGRLGLRRVLDSTVDDVLVDGDWAVLTKAMSFAR